MGGYWLGLATPFLIAGALCAAVRAHWAATRWLDDRGYSVEVKWNRRLERIDDYTLKHNIWFEGQRGPVFVGHWCRYTGWRDGEDINPVVTRWLGIGSRNGPCIMFFKIRPLS